MLSRGLNAKTTVNTRQRRDLWKEHPILTGVAAIGVIIILGYIAVVIGFWWGRLPPKRPSAVAPEAVWTRGPGNPVPRQHGHWILCSVKETGRNAHCRIWNESGNLDFEGDFRVNRRSVLSPTTGLAIDTRLTGQLNVRIRDTLVPIIYLIDRKILIPVEAFSRQLNI